MNELLSHEETIALIKRAQSGDATAEETLVVKNIALVKSIVRGYLKRGAEYEDLMQIGSMGLVKAIKGYDERFHVRFSTYAVPMISGEIKRFLRDDGMIKVSRSLKENAIKVFRAQETLKKELGREPELSELAQKTQISEEDIVACLDAVRDPISIYEPVYQDKNAKSALLLDTMTDVTVKEENLVTDRLLLQELLAKLSERERRIILLRFFRDKTQSEIARDIGVSQVQVSRLLLKTMEKLKEMAEE